MKLYRLTIFLLLIIIASCNNQGKPKDFDYGRVENNQYINSFFDVKMTVPAGWIIQTKEQMDNLSKVGKELVTGDNSKMKAALKASEINTANLLSVFQYEVGSAVDYNPSLMLIAENIKHAPGIKTGKDYLFQTRKLLEQSQLKYDRLDTESTKEVINGMEFYKMNAEINYMGLTIKQIYYTTILNGFSFNVILSFINDQQKSELAEALNSMKFNN